MSKIRICNEPECHNAATTEGYCRLHYLRHWKTIKDESRRRSSKKLNKYIEHVMSKHPDRYVEIIKKDLRSPTFNNYIDDMFGSPGDEEATFEGPMSYDEEIEELIKQLKLEKGF